MSCNGKRSTENLENSAEAKRYPPESEAFSEIYQELTNLTSQVQMMSDSLVACKQMSKYRSLRKTYSLKGHTQIDSAVPQTSVQVLLSSDQERLKSHQKNNKERALIVSYMLDKTPPLMKDSKDFGKGLESGQKRGSQRCGSLKEESQRPFEENSPTDVLEPKEVNAVRTISFIQGELNILKETAPKVAGLVTALCDSISHYKECDRCRVKITPSLPLILNRIQKLVEYVAERKQISYHWPIDNSYLWLRANEPAAEVHSLPPKVSKKFESISPFSVDGGSPGVQLLLEVKSKKARKRFFAKAENHSPSVWSSSRSSAVVQLKEPESVPVIQVLRVSPKVDISLTEKRGVSEVKESAYSLRLVFGYHLGFLASFFISHPVTRLIRTKTSKLEPPFKSNGPVSGKRETSRVRKKSHEDKNKDGVKTGQQKESHSKRSNENNQSHQRDILVRDPNFYPEFLWEGKGEKMHDQRVQNLEAGVKGLQNIMTEVHKNQVALSKLLMEKNIHSQSIFRLTDPSILDRENEMVRQVAEIQMFGPRSFSFGALQMAVNDLIHKCSLKNRIIMIILKGLQSNTPKECWEDMVEYAFSESKPVEDFYPEEVSEFVERASNFSVSGQKSKPQAWALRSEELSSEEELKIKEKEGEDFEEELKNLSHTDKIMAEAKDAISLTKFEDFPADFLAFPLTSQPDMVSNSIRKLENQLSLLNTENEKLWHEVHDLKNLLMNSIRDFNEKRISRVDSDKQPLNSQSLTKTTGKTINLIIQIVDKDFQLPKDPGIPVKLSKISISDGEKSRNPAVKYRSAESLSGLKHSDTKRRQPEHYLGIISSEPEFMVGSRTDRCRSESDLHYLDEPSASIFDQEHEDDRLRSVFKENFFDQAPGRQMHQLVMSSSHPSCRRLKPVMWVPSEYKIPEVSGCHQAGPSRSRAEVGYLLQKPSLMRLTERRAPDMVSMMVNERELQTIPENDCSPSTSSKGLSQEIQRLRARVRLIHKNVIVLKSKNDRIDKLLDRLMNDAVESGQSFRDIKHDFNRLMNQLG